MNTPRIKRMAELQEEPAMAGFDTLYPEEQKQALARRTAALRVHTRTAEQQVPQPQVWQQPQYGYPPYPPQIPQQIYEPQYLSSPPMTESEMAAFSQKPRRLASHNILKRASTCLNCEFFFAYHCQNDGTHRNVCTYLGLTPWTKDFTCGSSFCGHYVEHDGKARTMLAPACKTKQPIKRRTRTPKAEVTFDVSPSNLTAHEQPISSSEA